MTGWKPIYARWGDGDKFLRSIEHRLRELFRVANRIVVLNFGEKLAEGSSKAVMADERVKEAYFGSQKIEEVMRHA